VSFSSLFVCSTCFLIVSTSSVTDSFLSFLSFSVSCARSRSRARSRLRSRSRSRARSRSRLDADCVANSIQSSTRAVFVSNSSSCWSVISSWTCSNWVEMRWVKLSNISSLLVRFFASAERFLIRAIANSSIWSREFRTESTTASRAELANKKDLSSLQWECMNE
jgi:hypothetical protein